VLGKTGGDNVSEQGAAGIAPVYRAAVVEHFHKPHRPLMEPFIECLHGTPAERRFSSNAGHVASKGLSGPNVDEPPGAIMRRVPGDLVTGQSGPLVPKPLAWIASSRREHGSYRSHMSPHRKGIPPVRLCLPMQDVEIDARTGLAGDEKEGGGKERENGQL
jgi:hypothetical protein